MTIINRSSGNRRIIYWQLKSVYFVRDLYIFRWTFTCGFYCWALSAKFQRDHFQLWCFRHEIILLKVTSLLHWLFALSKSKIKQWILREAPYKKVLCEIFVTFLCIARLFPVFVLILRFSREKQCKLPVEWKYYCTFNAGDTVSFNASRSTRRCPSGWKTIRIMSTREDDDIDYFGKCITGVSRVCSPPGAYLSLRGRVVLASSRSCCL